MFAQVPQQDVDTLGGYIHINIDKSVYRAHRLAFLYMEGYVPEHCVDHIDRNPSNNKWSNLREVSHQCNSRNRKVCVNSKSGITGVIWYKDRKKWVAHIKTIEKLIFLGYFENKLDAAKARWEAEKKYGYPNCCVDSSSYLYIQKHKILDKENSEVRYA
jgi:hypothetical protein